MVARTVFTRARTEVSTTLWSPSCTSSSPPGTRVAAGGDRTSVGVADAEGRGAAGVAAFCSGAEAGAEGVGVAAVAGADGAAGGAVGRASPRLAGAEVSRSAGTAPTSCGLAVFGSPAAWT